MSHPCKKKTDGLPKMLQSGENTHQRDFLPTGGEPAPGDLSEDKPLSVDCVKRRFQKRFQLANRACQARYRRGSKEAAQPIADWRLRICLGSGDD
jgi:hypothetical protein